MTKQDWIKNTAAATGLSQRQAAAVLEAGIGEIKTALAQGEHLRVPGLGSFKTQQMPARSGHNPRTGAAIKIPARTRVQFAAAQALKDAVQPKLKAVAKKAKAKAKAKSKRGK